MALAQPANIDILVWWQASIVYQLLEHHWSRTILLPLTCKSQSQTRGRHGILYIKISSLNCSHQYVICFFFFLLFRNSRWHCKLRVLLFRVKDEPSNFIRVDKKRPVRTSGHRNLSVIGRLNRLQWHHGRTRRHFYCWFVCFCFLIFRIEGSFSWSFSFIFKPKSREKFKPHYKHTSWLKLPFLICLRPNR